MRNKNFPIKIILFMITLLVVSSVLIFIFKTNRASSSDDWKKNTSPLRQEVIDDLCDKFNLQMEDSLCTADHLVFAPDFFPVIEKTFIKGATTFDDVQLLLEPYLVDLEDLSRRNDSTYFWAWYDFQGDGMTALIFDFDGDYKNNELNSYVEFFWQLGDLKAGAQ